MIVTLLVGMGLGGAGGYALSRVHAYQREQQMQRELAAAREMKALPCPPIPKPAMVPSPLPQEKYRAPDPKAVINVPIDKDDFAQMAEAFCTCWNALREEHGRPPTVDELRDCFLAALYPDFAWPPVPGDPASAQLLWMVADHEARKLHADPRRCARPQDLQIGGGG